MFMLCGIFVAGVCEMYAEIILIRLSQFLLPPSPHAPLNPLSLPLMPHFIFSSNTWMLADKILDTTYSVINWKPYFWWFCFPPAPDRSTASHQSIGRQRRHWGWHWSPCRQSWGCPWCQSPRSPLCASHWEGQIWNSLWECRWSCPGRWDMLLLLLFFLLL